MIKGSYKGYSHGLYAFSVLSGSLFIPMLSVAAVSWKIMVIGIVVSAFGMVFCTVMPARFRANDRGVTIRVAGFDFEYKYPDIRAVSCEYITTRYSGALVRLTIDTDFGSGVFCENLGLSMADILNHPDNYKQPGLMRLSEYIKAKI